MRKVIVSADDYGYTSNISRGIRDAFKEGVLTATSAIMNRPRSVEDVANSLEETPGLAIGVHLNIYRGKPISDPGKVKTLVDEEGNLLGKRGIVKNASKLDVDDVETEYRAQIKALLSTGYQLDHINDHGVSNAWLSLDLWDLMLRLCIEYDCPTRVPINFSKHSTEDGDKYFEAIGLTRERVEEIYKEQLDILKKYDLFCADDVDLSIVTDQSSEKLANRLKTVPEDKLIEFVCHAGYSDAELANFSAVTTERDRTVEILTNPLVIRAIKENNIILTTLSKERSLVTKEEGI